MPRHHMKHISITLAAALVVVLLVVLFAPRGGGVHEAREAGETASRSDAQRSVQRDRTRADAGVGGSVADPGAASASAVADTADVGASPGGVDTTEADAPTTETLAMLAQRAADGLRGGADGPPRDGAVEAQTLAERRAAALAAAGSGRANDSEAPADAREDAARVGGIVIRGGEPLPRAHLRLTDLGDGASRNTTTADNGRYQFRGVNPGGYRLTLVEPQSEDSTRIVNIQPNGDRLDEDFVVPDPPSLFGTVSNSSTGAGIGGAELEVWRGDERRGTVTSLDDGSFQLMVLAAGNYRLEGRAPGYSPGEITFRVNAVGDSPPVRLTLEPRGNLTGIVRDADGVPLPGAQVGLFGGAAFGDPFARFPTVFTDGGGRFEFTAPPGGMPTDFRVGAWHSQWIPAYSNTIPRGELTSTEDVEVIMARGVVAEGIVVDSQELEFPLAGTLVSVSSGFGNSGAVYTRFNRPYPSATTGEDGRFSLGPLEPGATTLRFAAELYIPLDKGWTLAASADPVDLGTIPLDSEEDTEAGRIFGAVIDERGAPLTNHYVLIRNVSNGQEFSNYTDAQGGFIFDDLPEGEYVVHTHGSALRGDQYITMDQRYPFARPGDEKIFLIYDMAQSLRVRVENAMGQPVTRFRIGLNNRTDGALGFGGVRETFGQGMEREFQTAEGDGLLDNLMGGTVNVTITSEAFGTYEARNLTVPVGGRLDMGTVVLEGGNSLEGVVVDGATNQGVAGVLVRMMAPAGAPTDHPLHALRPRITTDGAGRFLLRGITAPNADLLLERDGRVTLRVRNIQLHDRVTNLGEIATQAAAILGGRVQNPQGAPINNVVIRIGDATIFSDPEGRFLSNQVPAGSITLDLQDPSQQYRLSPFTLQLPAEGKTDLVITMEPR